MSDKKFEVINCEALFQGYYRVERYKIKQEKFDGGWSEPFTREVFNRSRHVSGVLLFDPLQDKVVLVEQFRTGALPRQDDPWMTEIVMGMVDSNETPEAAARRESQEEANCIVSELVPITSYYSSPGGTSEYISLFAGRTSAPRDGSLAGLASENEYIKLHVLDATKAISMIYNNRIRDAQTMVAMQWFAMHHTELRSRWLVSDVGTPII